MKYMTDLSYPFLFLLCILVQENAGSIQRYFVAVTLVVFRSKETVFFLDRVPSIKEILQEINRIENRAAIQRFMPRTQIIKRNLNNICRRNVAHSLERSEKYYCNRDRCENCFASFLFHYIWQLHQRTGSSNCCINTVYSSCLGRYLLDQYSALLLYNSTSILN